MIQQALFDDWKFVAMLFGLFKASLHSHNVQIRASLKVLYIFKFGGVVRHVEQPAKIQAQFSQPRTSILVQLCILTFLADSKDTRVVDQTRDCFI